MKTLETNILTPEQIPIKCPVCAGFGTVNWGKQKCHGCNRKGYILVDSKEEEKDGRKR